MAAETSTISFLDKLRRAVEEDPDSLRAHLKLGLALIKAQQYGPAEAELRRALQIDSGCVEAWINLGGVCLTRLDFAGCVEANNNAIEHDPQALLAHYNKGLGHLYLKQTHELVDCFRRVLEIDAEHAGGNYYMAVGLHSLGNTPEAWMFYQKALQLGFAPQPEFVRVMGRYEENIGGGAVTVEIGSDSQDTSTPNK
ncbi:MAG TPA: tetratricopeptide repeat protein [Myxococcota bacterium]|nr:tetratricopeptide repeat protein [Myxococcota bacterium]